MRIKETMDGKNNTKVALAMIVKGTDEEANLLDRCLGGIDRKKLRGKHREIDLTNTEGLARHIDGIFITLTQKNKKCEEVAKKYGANISYWDWNNNFADARNFNFSQVTKDYNYIMWSDTDDVWRNPNMISDMMQKASEEAIDAIVVNYLYDFNQYGDCTADHLKTMFVKNDKCVEWAGDIHEDFKENRNIVAVKNNNLKRIHLVEDERIKQSFIRNTSIALESLTKNPKDPRTYWNLANSYISEKEYEKAIPIYLDFIDRSNSEEERFLAWHRLAIAYKMIGDNARAIATELEALALRPWYPDPYFGLGELYVNMNKLKHAKEFIEIGFTKDIPDSQAIVWNPRDYDYNPRKLLARVYLGLSKPRETVKNLKKCLEVCPKDKGVKDLIKSLEPEIKKFDVAESIYKKAIGLKNKEEIKKLLDSVPKDMKYYPAIVNLRNIHFIKEKSSGKDVVIYCSYTSTEWDLNTFNEKGVGGSEEAVIQLARRWVRDGWNVTVYANIPKQQERVIEGITWKPFMAWNYRDKQDVVVLWRHPKAADYNINADIILVDIHDVVSPQEFTPSRINNITKIMFKSKIHRDYYPRVPDDKVEIIPHGLDIKQFEERSKVIKKNPYKIINTSSPDRGLLTNLEIIERVYDKLPDNLKDKLKFRWNYGFKVWDTEFSNDEQMVAWKSRALSELERLKKKGIVEEGSGDMISQNAIVDQYLESGLLLYPSEFFEIGFISGIKGAIAGAIPVTTDVFAQGEFLGDGIIIPSKVNYDNWVVDITEGLDYGVKTKEQKDMVVDKIVDYFTNVEKYGKMREKIQKRVKKEFNWSKTARAWAKLF